MEPSDAPWTEEFQELHESLKERRQQYLDYIEEQAAADLQQFPYKFSH